MKVVRALADAIAREGVREVFLLLGSSNYRVAHHLRADHGLPLRQARHESGAVAAADGFARVTGEVGFCTVTGGPGFTNTITPLVTAAKAHTPLVLLTGSTVGVPGRSRPFGVNMALDPVPVLEGLGIPSVIVRAASVYADVRAAFARAEAEQRPVVLVLHSAEEARDVGDVPHPAAPIPPLQPSPADVRDVADLLERAERPLLLAGHGAARAGAGPALVELAAHTGGLLATTLRAWNLFAGDPYDLGVAGGFGSGAALDVMARSDLVLAVGAGLNDFTTKKGSLVDGRTLIQVDTREEAFGLHTPVGHRVLGDARLVAEALLAELRQRSGPRTGWRTPEVVAGVRSHTGAPVADESTDGWLDPRALCTALERLLPPDRAIVTDGGHFALFPATHMTVPDPSALVWTLDFGATGGGLGAALGAALGRPERLTVLFIGDGGFLMALGDLDDLVRYGVPLLIVIMNNEAYASEVSLFERAGLPGDLSRFVTPSLAGIARAIGAAAETITSLEQLADLAARTADLRGPLVLDCKVQLIPPSALASL